MGMHVCAVHLVSQQLHMLLVPLSKAAHHEMVVRNLPRRRHALT